MLVSGLNHAVKTIRGERGQKRYSWKLLLVLLRPLVLQNLAWLPWPERLRRVETVLLLKLFRNVRMEGFEERNWASMGQTAGALHRLLHWFFASPKSLLFGAKSYFCSLAHEVGRLLHHFYEFVIFRGGIIWLLRSVHYFYHSLIIQRTIKFKCSWFDLIHIIWHPSRRHIPLARRDDGLNLWSLFLHVLYRFLVLDGRDWIINRFYHIRNINFSSFAFCWINRVLRAQRTF